MQRFISLITGSLVLLAGSAFAQSTTINGGGPNRITAEVKSSALSGTEKGLVVRCASGCGGGSGSGTEFAEDAAHASGDAGTLVLGVRRDADTTPVSADGDYHALQFDNAGNLKVNIKAGAGSGGTAMTDDAAFTPATTSGTPAFFMFDDVSPDSVNEGDGGIGRMSANRNQYVTIRDAAGNERGLNIDASGNMTVNVTGTVTVGSHAVTNAGTFAVQAAQSGTWTVQPGNTANTTPWLTTISQGGNAAVVNGSGQLSITCANCSGSGASAVDDAAFTPAVGSGAPAMGMFDNVSPDSVDEGDAGVLRMSANRSLFVNIRDNAGNERGLNIDASGNLTANITGSVAVTGTFWQATQPVSMATNTPAGSVAHDGVGTGVNPVLMGGYASAAAPTDVSADGDAVRGWFLRSGAQAVQPTYGGVLASTGNGASGTGVPRVTIANDSTGTLIVTQATGTNLHIVCDSGCGAGTQYAEDAAETAGASLSMAGSVRRDTAASSAGTTGDNATINTDSIGRLWTRPTGAVTPANSFAIPSDAITVWSINGCYNGTTIDLCTKATAGAGAVDSGTQRITWASDAPGIKAEDVAHTTADPGFVILTKRTDTAASSAGTDGDYATLNTDSSGNLWIRCSSGCGAGTQYAEDIAHTTGDQMTMAGAVRRDTAASSSGTDGDISTINVDASGRLWVNPGTIGVEDAAETAGGNLNMIGTVRRDTAASSAGTTGDNATLNTDANGKLWANAEITQGGNSAQVTASGTLKITNYDSSGNEIVVPTAGLTSYTAAGASTNATSVKASAGTVYHYSLTNTTTTIYYLRMYNLATSPTCSSATGYVSTIPIPPAAASGQAGGREKPMNIGQAFTTGVAFCITGGSGSTDNTNAAAGVFVELLYK